MRIPVTPTEWLENRYEEIQRLRTRIRAVEQRYFQAMEEHEPDGEAARSRKGAELRRELSRLRTELRDLGGET